MRNKYYIFHTSCDYVDAVCSLIKFVGGSVYTIITNREVPEGSINHCRVYCRLSWAQMMRLKRRLKYGKKQIHRIIVLQTCQQVRIQIGMAQDHPALHITKHPKDQTKFRV